MIQPAPAEAARATVLDPEEPAEGIGASEPESLRRRLLRPETLASFAIAAAIIVFVFRRLDIDLAAVWRIARTAHPGLYAAAFAVYYAAFVLRARRWRGMLGRAGIDRARGYHLPGLGGLVEIFVISWFANSVVPAKLGDAYRSYLLKRETKASFSTTIGTILAERLIDLVTLVLVLTAAAVAVFGRRVPGEATQTFAVGLVLLAVGGLGLVAMWLFRARVERRLPARVRDQYGRLHQAVFACLSRPAGFVAIGAAVWLTEGLRLFLVAAALGADVSVGLAVFVALMGSLLTAVPITPAGLGVVEAATVVILKLVGIEAAMAGSIALLDRVVSYWSVIAVGLILYARRARRDLG